MLKKKYKSSLLNAQTDLLHNYYFNPQVLLSEFCENSHVCYSYFNGHSVLSDFYIMVLNFTWKEGYFIAKTCFSFTKTEKCHSNETYIITEV